MPTLRTILSSPRALAAAIALWLALVGGGMAVAMRFESTAGAEGAHPGAWPEGAPLARSSDAATLVLFAHPRCPCTRASIAALAEVRARAGASLGRIVVCVYRPSDAPEGWERGASWDEAAAIPGATLAIDADGALARRFGAHTSGQVLVYDAGGRLAYSGGITPGRGKDGPSAGRDGVLSFLAGGPPPPSNPVFGCPITEECGGGECPAPR